MNLQRLYSYARKAIDEYKMIQEGDKIAIGISGGKDSLAMLYALSGLKHFYLKKFELEAITVHLGFEGFDLSSITKLCNDLEVSYTIVDTTIGSIVFDDRKEKNPCSLCAKMRKGALNEKAKELGCNKIAYGHHKDDIVETMLLSLIFEGRFHTFSPLTYLDRMDLTVIRPFLYLNEEDIVNFVRNYNVPVAKNPCPADGYTKREYAKKLLKQLDAEHFNTTERMFRAILNGNLAGWPEQNK